MGGFATVAAVIVMVVAVMVWRSLDFVDTEAFDSTQMLATSMAAAIGREAGYSGAPALLRRPSDLQAYIEDMGALLGLGLVVVDGDGKALAAAPPELEGAALLAQGIGVARMAADAGRPLRLRLPTGDRPDEARWLAAPILNAGEGGDGALLMEYSRLYETIWMRHFLFILPLTGIAMVVVALALGIGLSTSRRIVKPLQTLRASARDLGKGRLEDPIRVSSGDEVEDLAWTLDEVRLELKQARKATEGEIAVRRRAEQDLQEAHTRLTRWVKDLNERTQEMSLLSQMSDLLQSCHILEEAYPIVSRFAGQLFPAEPGAVYMMDPSKRLVVAAARWGARPPDVEAFAPDQCWALRRGQIHLVRSPDEGPLCGHVDTVPPSGYLCAPMMAHGEALGLFHIACCYPIPVGEAPAAGRLDGASERLAVAIAGQIGMALANLKLRETLQHQAIRDPLTGLFNRRYMEETLERESHRVRRSGLSLGVIMMDIDHFKRFNDRFGHESGDEALRILGGFLRANVRGGDIACRYGGEEFVLIMPGASLESSRERAEDLTKRFDSQAAEYAGGSRGSLTISMGVAAMPANGKTWKDALEAADRALYRAKELGRNRVEVAR